MYRSHQCGHLGNYFCLSEGFPNFFNSVVLKFCRSFGKSVDFSPAWDLKQDLTIQTPAACGSLFVILTVFLNVTPLAVQNSARG